MSLFKRKDSSCWWVKIIIDGRKVQRSSGTDDKIKAQEFHDRLKAQMWEESRLGVKPKRSWKDSVLRWLEETADKATHNEDRKKLAWLDTYLGDLTLDEITLDVIDRVRSERLKDVSKTTVNRYLEVVRAILRRARDEWEWIERIPKIKLFKINNSRERSLTPEQARALIRELPDHMKDVVLFSLATGLRQSNVLQLEWEQVNLALRHAWVRGSESKNRHPISVPLNEIALETLQRQIGKHATRVFTYRGNPINSVNTKAWRAALRRADIQDFRWHDLRHTWATWQRQAGTPTHELQHLGGWRTGAMVERYAHLAPDHLSQAASRLDSILAVTATF